MTVKEKLLIEFQISLRDFQIRSIDLNGPKFVLDANNQHFSIIAFSPQFIKQTWRLFVLKHEAAQQALKKEPQGFPQTHKTREKKIWF